MKFFPCSLLALFLALPFSPALGQDSREIQIRREQAAKTRPVQSDVEIDLIADTEIPLCTLTISEDNRQMTLLSPQKTVLRKFVDASGDPERQVDQWSYYQNGIEVYRELDTNGDGKQDQFRWLNSAGTRWGVDENGDGKIDYWKEISAEEVSREIVLSLTAKDVRRFLCVALKEDELKSLALGEPLNNTVAKKAAALQAGFAAVSAALALAGDAEWYQLSAVLPSVVPKGEQGSQKDLLVYENAAVTISDAGRVRQILIGTLVKIGDNNWRILDLPKNYDEEQVSFTFIQPVHAQGNAGHADSEIVAIMNQVMALQAQIPDLPAEQRPEQHKLAVALLLEIVKKSSTQEERENWIRQIADTIMEAASRNEYPDGKEQIAKIFETVNKPTIPELAAHVRSRQIMVNYYVALSADSDSMKGYTQWLADLEDLVTAFPKTEAGLEGMMQLASYKEMADPSSEESIKWYEKIIEFVPGQPQAVKARGAIRRLTAEGKEIPFRVAADVAGKTFDITEYKGKFVLLCFWDSHSAAQLAITKAVTDKFEPAGLAVVGINLDPDEAALRKSLSSAPATWRHLYALGGLDGELAAYWGIITSPCMILYDKAGKVVRSNISTLEELQQVLTELVK